MNKLLFQKVKDQCKDTGLSEECLKAITEAIGGSITDDSTDEEAIGNVANQISKVAVASQSEAARWANKQKKDQKNRKDQTTKKDDDHQDGEHDHDDDDPVLKAVGDLSDAVKKLTGRMDTFEGNKKTQDRQALIKAAMENHKIPAKFRDRLAKSIGDDEDIEETVKAFKQDFITEGLNSEEQHENKTATEQQVNEAADALLESITVK